MNLHYPIPPKDVEKLLRSYAERNQNRYKILLEELRKHFNVFVGAELDFSPLFFARHRKTGTEPYREVLTAAAIQSICHGSFWSGVGAF
ncbi:MAG: hypothetical protein ACJAX5_000263 [Patiriisocius sp.]|jgi:hypothetical protein